MSELKDTIELLSAIDTDIDAIVSRLDTQEEKQDTENVSAVARLDNHEAKLIALEQAYARIDMSCSSFISQIEVFRESINEEARRIRAGVSSGESLPDAKASLGKVTRSARDAR